MNLSIIVPVYNVEKYLSVCLECLYEQGLDIDNYEVITINDGSTDNSLKIIQNFAEKHSNIVIVDKKNAGIGNTRNCGLSLAKGDYIYFIDSDDYMLPNCLNKLLEISKSNNLDILTFKSRPFPSSEAKINPTSEKFALNDSQVNMGFSKVYTGEDYIAKFKYRNEVWSYLIKREFLNNTKIRFEEGRNLEDIGFSLKLFLEAKRVAHLNLEIHRYRKTPGSIMTSKKIGHYNSLIRDMQYVALDFDSIIKTLKNRKANPECIKRIKGRQQAIILFSLLRMLKSTMSFEEVKLKTQELVKTKTYPLNSCSREDFSGFKYRVLLESLRTENRFYFLFKTLNPIFRLRYRFNKSA